MVTTDKVKELQKVTITTYSDGNITVDGPIDNLLAFFGILTNAQEVVLRRAAKRVEEMKAGIAKVG